MYCSALNHCCSLPWMQYYLSKWSTQCDLRYICTSACFHISLLWTKQLYSWNFPSSFSFSLSTPKSFLFLSLLEHDGSVSSTLNKSCRVSIFPCVSSKCIVISVFFSISVSTKTNIAFISALPLCNDFSIQSIMTSITFFFQMLFLHSKHLDSLNHFPSVYLFPGISKLFFLSIWVW